MVEYIPDRQRDNRAQLLDTLEAIKRQNPELEEILRKFQIDQAEYDNAMLTLLASQFEPHSTYATGEDLCYA